MQTVLASVIVALVAGVQGMPAVVAPSGAQLLEQAIAAHAEQTQADALSKVRAVLDEQELALETDRREADARITAKLESAALVKVETVLAAAFAPAQVVEISAAADAGRSVRF